MSEPSGGNGDGTVAIQTTQKDDWVLFSEGQPPPARDQLPKLLSVSLEQWLDTNPRCRVRAVLPLVAEGTTEAIRLWYDS